jgi:hypothetical protein
VQDVVKVRSGHKDVSCLGNFPYISKLPVFSHARVDTDARISARDVLSQPTPLSVRMLASLWIDQTVYAFVRG